jgi:DNA-binding MarR family transcriptional regulator
MAHLARRFNDLCSNAANIVTRREGLEPVEFATLASVHDAPGNDSRRLAERIGVPTAKALRYLKHLEDRGLIQRKTSKGPRGPGTYEISSQGTKLLLSIRPEVFEAMERVTASLSNDERETLRELLVRVIKANEAKNKAE